MTLASAANAHRLKVFATVEAGAITGYGFFVGGGRPRGSAVIIRDANGQEVFKGETDEEGRFSWRPSSPSDFTISVDTREGHMAEARIAANRFSVEASNPVQAAPAIASTVAAKPADAGQPHAPDMSALIESAVSRQVRPVLERLEALDGSLQLRDIVSGICMIFGLAGIALWIISRKSSASGKREG
jgi:nickel transport protein